MNVLLITLDQFRAECLSIAGHPLVKTPNLDRLARGGMRFAQHYSQCAPCSPGRASLYTGMYQMNHRVVTNGTPLDRRFDNVALLARRAGYAPTLFGYTDQAFDPRDTSDQSDPRLSTYEGVLPGFDCELFIPEPFALWVEHLRQNGYDVPMNSFKALNSEPDRPESLSIGAFVADHVCNWLRKQDRSWFAHASFLRPHPPYAAAGKWSKEYDPADVSMPIEPSPIRHPFHETVMHLPQSAGPTEESEKRHMRAQYYGMISEVDSQVGRVLDTLDELGMWDNTMIIVTADHADQLGDHGLREKLGFFEQSYHIVGIVRDPRHVHAHGTVVEEFTENVDIVPTIAETLGQEVPLQCDGFPLTPFLEGVRPDNWRDAASYEYDWRHIFISKDGHSWPWDRRLERQNLAVRRSRDSAYVQFGDGTWLAFDLAVDPTWRTTFDDPARVLPLAQDMLTWRSRNAERILSGFLVQDGGMGHWPPGVPWK
ncbi:MAG: sulfatase-like hydrolase/transferase [Ilumatobacteraceae bacterium]